MNAVVLKHTIRRNWKLPAIFSCVLCLYEAVIIGLIDPRDMDKVRDLYGTIGGYLGAFGIRIESMTTPLSYTASTFFSLIVMAFAMVFYVIQANLLIARPVEDTSIVYTLASPVSRFTLAMTQGIYLIVAMLLLFGAVLGCGAAMLATFGKFDFWAFLDLVAVTFLLCTAIGMFSYFLSVLFCGSKFCTGISAGAPIALLFMAMIGGAGGEKTEWMKKVSPFGWLDSVGIVTGEVDTAWMYPVFLGAILVFLFASAVVFRKKPLPI